MMMHTTLAQLRTLKLDGLAGALEEQLTQASMAAMSFEERLQPPQYSVRCQPLLSRSSFQFLRTNE